MNKELALTGLQKRRENVWSRCPDVQSLSASMDEHPSKCAEREQSRRLEMLDCMQIAFD
jgi:hypothetical protein